MRTLRMAFISLGLCWASSAATEAGYLYASPVAAVVGPGTATGVAATPGGNNFVNNPAFVSTNTLAIDASVTGAGSPLDIVLRGGFTGGTAQYLATVGITNLTGASLTGYVFQLGSGSGSGFASYPQPSTAAPFLYEGTPATSSDSFAAAPLLPYTLTFSQGQIAAGGVGHFTFNLIVTNLGSPFPFDNPPPFDFTLRLTPATAVPEPSSAILTGLGVASLAWAGFGRRRRSVS